MRDEELVIVEHPGLYDFHQGGSPRFGLDGMLYLGIGDGTCSECSRYLDTLLGKIIRIDVARRDRCATVSDSAGQPADQRSGGKARNMGVWAKEPMANEL